MHFMKENILYMYMFFDSNSIVQRVENKFQNKRK